MKSRFDIAKQDIQKHFSSLSTKILCLDELQAIFNKQKKFWRLPEHMGRKNFIHNLLKKTALKEVTFPFPNRQEVRYVWGEAPLLAVVASLKKRGYFTHYTAMHLHGLTDQIPTTIFLNEEQSEKSANKLNVLSQSAIDQAFKRNVRISHNVAEIEKHRICLLSGKFTNNAGVISIKMAEDGPILPVTSLERTLIDITVRPVYSGGVQEVLSAFERAKDTVQINRMLALLHKINFIYPYHQAIGFYLERAGYSAAQLKLLDKFKKEYDFYLVHGMKSSDYSSKWRLFFPKGF